MSYRFVRFYARNGFGNAAAVLPTAKTPMAYTHDDVTDVKRITYNNNY